VGLSRGAALQGDTVQRLETKGAVILIRERGESDDVVWLKRSFKASCCTPTFPLPERLRRPCFELMFLSAPSLVSITQTCSQ